MSKFLYVLTVIGSIVGGFFLIGAFLEDSAPKQATSAAIAVAFAVIPYCLARASSALFASESVAELKRLNETLTTHTRLLAAVANSAEPVATSGRDLPTETPRESQPVVRPPEKIIDEQELARRFKEWQEKKP